jgi:hypothetical protein
LRWWEATATSDAHPTLHQEQLVDIALALIQDRDPCPGCGNRHFNEEELDRIRDGIAIMEEFNVNIQW